MPAGARLGAVRARRDPDPGRHHAEHAPHGADDRHAQPRDAPSATCTTTTSRRTPPVRPAAWARPSAARSATARSPSGRSCRCCRRARSSRTRSARCPRRSAPTARPRWARSAPRRCRCWTPVCRSRQPVAGIAMGLVSTRDGEYVTLTDILGAEDAFGDMDFKVAGTKDVRHRAAARHQARRHPRLGAGRRAEAGQGRPPGDPRRHAGGHRRPGRDEPERAAHHHDQDPGRQDRRGHRPEGQDDQPDPGRHRRRDHHRGRRHDLRRRHRRPVRRGRAARRSTRSPTRTCPRSASATWARSSRPRPSAPSSRCCRARTACCTSRRSASCRRQARIENVEDVVNVGEKIQVEITEIDSRGKLSLVPVEVVEREAAAEGGSGAPRTTRGDADAGRAPRRRVRRRPPASHAHAQRRRPWRRGDRNA